jgi:tRNA pseudouridine55 synthase
MDGILLIDKPAGITSCGALRVLQRRFGVKKMGHAGTLDPLATGLLIVGVGKATKQFEQFLKLSKVYETDILLGVATDTGDLAGRVLDSRDSSYLSEKSIQKAVASCVGELLLPVPLYSATKINGKALYKHAYKGNPHNISPPVRLMKIHSAHLVAVRIEQAHSIVTIRFDVASGTYIRSVAEELGKLLDLPATVSKLRRISIGQYSIEDAIPLYEATPAHIRPIVEMTELSSKKV